MKKLRMIISAFAVGAVVSTALAFTPRVDGTFCINSNPNAQFCPTKAPITFDNSQSLKRYASLPASQQCSSSTPCTTTARFVVE